MAPPERLYSGKRELEIDAVNTENSENAIKQQTCSQNKGAKDLEGSLGLVFLGCSHKLRTLFADIVDQTMNFIIVVLSIMQGPDKVLHSIKSSSLSDRIRGLKYLRTKDVMNESRI